MDANPSRLTDHERDAIATITLLAAQVDGLGEGERTHLRDVFEAIGGVSSAKLYQDVLLGHATLGSACTALTSPGVRAYAYEMAVGACDANGHTTDEERAFLDDLAARLSLPGAEATAVRDQAEALADAPLAAMEPTPRTSDAAPQAAPDASATPVAPSGTPKPNLDGTILNNAILAGGLELLPQSLATMAIVPLQMKLVFDVGRAHGYALDQAKVRELLAIAGVGLTSQVLEGYARKLFGKALKKTMGKGARKVGKAASSALLTFATTYAIGKVADRYYGGGRSLTQADVRSVFTVEVERGKELFSRYRGDVEERARGTNLSALTRQLRM